MNQNGLVCSACPPAAPPQPALLLRRNAALGQPSWSGSMQCVPGWNCDNWGYLRIPDLLAPPQVCTKKRLIVLKTKGDR